MGQMSILGVCKLPDPAHTGSDRTRAGPQQFGFDLRLKPWESFCPPKARNLMPLSCAGLRDAEIMTPKADVRPATAAIAVEM
jgi:hypothetical protein